MEDKNIADEYKGKSLLITGATGFLGKVLLEKLLYSCPGIEKVYLLIREKKNIDINERISSIQKLPLFSRLNEKRPNAWDKVIPIRGDLSQPNIGINIVDEQLLINTVSFAFHLAATIKFNEPLEKAMNINVHGTERVLNLCRRMKIIQAFVFMSTAYSNVNRAVIKEVIYPVPVCFSKVTNLIERGANAKQMHHILDGRPNTYTFTKALAENIVAKHAEYFPTVIIRPSIVCASHTEPVVGWVDNWLGATALGLSLGTGGTRVLLADGNNILDLVPVDFVSNLTLVTAASCKSAQDSPYVYNCTTSGANALTLRSFTDSVIDNSLEHNHYGFIKPTVFLINTKWLVILLTYILQVIPAYIMDAAYFILGRNSRFVKNMAKVIHIRDSLQYFTSNTWLMPAANTLTLYDSLSELDKKRFYFDLRTIDWNVYIHNYSNGIKKYLCK